MKENANISARESWALTARTLMRAYLASVRFFEVENGPAACEKLTADIWTEIGAGAAEFCNEFHLPMENARQIHRVSLLYAKNCFGPDFQFQIVEEIDNRVVGRATRCPFPLAAKEQRMADIRCDGGHRAWAGALTRTLNPTVGFSLTKTVMDGYPFCEWVVERKTSS
jgi:hypothetical protein